MGEITEEYEGTETITKETSIYICDSCGEEFGKNELAEVVIDPTHTDTSHWYEAEAGRMMTEYLWENVDWYANHGKVSNDNYYISSNSNVGEVLASQIEQHINRGIEAAATYDVCLDCINTSYNITLPESVDRSENMYTERGTTMEPEVVVPSRVWLIFSIIIAISLVFASQFPTYGMSFFALIIFVFIFIIVDIINK